MENSSIISLPPKKRTILTTVRIMASSRLFLPAFSLCASICLSVIGCVVLAITFLLSSFNIKQGSMNCPVSDILLFNDLQDLHGASLHADAAGDALRNRRLFLMYHDLHGADGHASATANA